MKVKKLKIFQDKMGLKGCKWSSLNAPGTETPQSHPYWVLGEFPFPGQFPFPISTDLLVATGRCAANGPWGDSAYLPAVLSFGE